MPGISILKGGKMIKKTDQKQEKKKKSIKYDWHIFLETLERLGEERKDGNIKRHAIGLIKALKI